VVRDVNVYHPYRAQRVVGVSTGPHFEKAFPFFLRLYKSPRNDSGANACRHESTLLKAGQVSGMV
jgi:hypothetical protein